jgi:hypothetical protein
MSPQLASAWPGPGICPAAEVGDASTTIAVLSWAWAAVAVVGGGRTSAADGPWPGARWLAAHPSDASLVSRLAGQLS